MRRQFTPDNYHKLLFNTTMRAARLVSMPEFLELNINTRNHQIHNRPI